MLHGPEAAGTPSVCSGIHSKSKHNLTPRSKTQHFILPRVHGGAIIVGHGSSTRTETFHRIISQNNFGVLTRGSKGQTLQYTPRHNYSGCSSCHPSVCVGRVHIKQHPNTLYTIFIIVIIAAAASQDAMAEIRPHGLSSHDYKHVEHLLTTRHLTAAQASRLQ